MSKLRRIFVWGGGLAVVGGMVGSGFLGGYEVATRQSFPYDLMLSVHRKLDQLVFSKVSQSSTIETGLIELKREDVSVSDGLEVQLKWGGGLTSFGEDVLVLRYEGDVFAAHSAGTLQKTRVVAPAINRAEYVADYRKLSDDPAFGYPEPRGADYLRYNDILYFHTQVWNGLLVSYVEYHPEHRCVTNTVAKAKIDHTVSAINEVTLGPDDWEVLFRSAPCLPFKPKRVPMEGHMSGGRMIVGSPATIFMASSDFGFDGIRSDGPAIAQDPDSQYGKMLSINIETGVADIVSSGLRNMQGLALTADGRLLSVEHGMRGGDELNLHRQGANFGWPLETYGTTYSKQRQPGAEVVGRHEHYEPPVFAWVPSIAVSNLIVVEGFHPAWDGDLLVATLKDASLRRLRLVGDRVVYDEPIRIGSPIRYVHQHTDGRIVLWTDNQELIFLEGHDLPSPVAQLDDYLATTDLDAGTQEQMKAAMLGCSECHSFSPGSSAGAPSLAKIYGERIGSTVFDGYSDAMKNKGGRWDDEALSAFLQDPAAFVPGTTMRPQGLENQEVIRAIVAYLKHLDGET